MTKTKKTPELRFGGFTEAWEERTYCSIAEIRRGLTYKPSDVEIDGIRVLRSSNIDEDTFVLRDDDVFVNKKSINIDYAKENDILITSANGSSRLVGKHAIISKVDNKAVHGGFMLLSTAKNPHFLNASMSSRWYIKFINVYVAGGNGAIGNLSKTDLEDQDIFLPSDQEQTQIGNFFQSLDALIALHQDKHEKLCSVKKAMLEKMFPKEGADVPEIRFKGLKVKWEQKKLGTIYSRIRNAFVGTASPYYVEEGHFYLESNNVKNGHINRNTEIFINDEFYQEQKDNWLHTGDLVMVQSGHVGHSAVIPPSLDNTAAHALIFFTDLKEKVNPYFLNYQFLTASAISKIETITTGNTIKHILSSDMKEFFVSIPGLKEQDLIANFFRDIDSLISLHQHELDKIKNIKKACFEKMFV